MQCFNLFYLKIANRILPLLLYTATVWFHFSKTKKYWQHNWVKYGEKMMVVPNIIYMPLHFSLCQLCLKCYSIIIFWFIRAPGHGKEFIYGLNAVDKRYIYQLISTVQLPGSNIFYSQMQMHTGDQKYAVSLAQWFQHHLKKYHRKDGVFDQKKNSKQFMEGKWTYRQYHGQYNADVAHQDVRIYSNTSQFP